MAFSRAFLKEHGVPEDQIDAIMAERNRTLNDYVPKSDLQAQIDAAVAAAKTAPVDVTTTEEYAKLAAERDMLRAIGSDDFAAVKPKFREQVFGMLDRSDKAPAIAEQLKTIGEKYEEYFVPQKDPEPETPPNKPSFGGQPAGSAPTGKTGPSFNDVWGFPTAKPKT